MRLWTPIRVFMSFCEPIKFFIERVVGPYGLHYLYLSLLLFIQSQKYLNIFRLLDLNIICHVIHKLVSEN